METAIKSAREFYGIYDYVSDETVKHLIECVSTKGIDWVKHNTRILKTMSYKNW